ncbi:uncharacterized protein LOC113494561 [Trichoplusia ni]|uniref:Uncharacterized protein LOC113494561 n=1 Tax=Trichoplusia ni TaxID=7111 RepID=A0A7E5VKD4_TRINI|nr:uncharacterized protein LOC113494561 [Trichoplusia ni]
MTDLVVNISSDESEEEAGIILNVRKVPTNPELPTQQVHSLSDEGGCTQIYSSNADDLYDDIAPAPSNSKGTKGKGLKRKSEGNSPENGKSIASVAAEKKTKKQKFLEEKAAKKAADEKNKMYKPGECMKHMRAEGHPSLWSRWYMSDVSRELAAAGARARHDPDVCDPALLVWSRTKPRTLQPTQGEVRLSPADERCDRALYITSAEEISELVSNHGLTPQLAQAQQLADCRLTLLLYRPHDFFKSNQRKTSNSNRMRVTEIELELALTDLLVSANCDTVVVNTPNELALAIVQFTKAIAEAPFKKARRECDEQAQFYMRGDNKKCVALDKDGVTGIGRLWQQMIAVLPQSSLETSRALCAKYPTPLALYQALQSSAVSEIAATGVSRAAAPGSRARRVGPEFARKLHTLFTAQSGDTLIE